MRPPEFLESPALDEKFHSYLTAQSQTAAAHAAAEWYHLGSVVVEGGRPQDEMSDVSSVLLAGSGSQSGLGKPGSHQEPGLERVPGDS